MEARTQCYNIFPNSSPVGIGTTSPAKKLNIYGDNTCPDVALQLTYYQDYWGHLALITNGNTGLYTQIPNSNPGDIVLQNETNAEDIILTTRNNNGHIRFATTPVPMAPDEERMTITPEGFIGIGTQNPKSELDVNLHYLGLSRIMLKGTPEPVSGTNNSTIKFYTWEGDASPFANGWEIENTKNGDLIFKSLFQVQNPDVDDNPIKRIAFTNDGKVTIGADRIKSSSDYYDDYTLSVSGTIVTTELLVTDLSEHWESWPDFVFEKDYPLLSLQDLDDHIKANKHLPGIPTAKEVAEKGLNIGEMQAKLLQKIEELTLYVIELKKENDEMKKQLEKMSKKNY